MKKTFTQILFVLFALISFTANANSGIFIRGGVNSWGTPAAWEFVDKGEGVYTIENVTLFGEFKVADAAWSTTCNYGGSGVLVGIGAEYPLVAGSNSNLVVEGKINCSEIQLVIVNNVATLLITGTTLAPEEIKQVYVMGDNNKWNFQDGSGVLLPVDGSTTQFAGEVTFPPTEGGALSFWRIYENLGLGSWGFEANTDAHTPNGTFVKGKEGCATVTPDTYKIRFDLATGVFSASPMSSVGSIGSDKNTVTVSNGVITVTGDATNVEVYSVSGSLISSNKKSIEVQSGVYVVIVDNKATKVAVK